MDKSKLAFYSNYHNNTLYAKMETDKKYLILKMGSFLITTAGLGWYILYALRGIRFALENEFIPVIDWQYCKIPQYESQNMGKDNVWEYFFEQPFGIDVNQAYRSRNYYVMDDIRVLRTEYAMNIARFVDFHDKELVLWRRYFQKYIRIKKNIKEYFEKCIIQQSIDRENTIGILARGSDYRELKPVGHFRTISEYDIFKQIEYIMKNSESKKIFLATEDKEIFDKFETRYGMKISSVNMERYENVGHNTLNTIYDKENGYERDLKYLYSLYIISQCEHGIYSACGGGAVAALMRYKEGISYNFLCNGYNRAKGIVVGSFIEKEQGSEIFVGKKPLMFYALNTLKLLHVKDIDIIVSDKVKKAYENIIGDGNEFGIKINYVVSDTYDVVKYMVYNSQFMTASKVIILHSDYFAHGKDLAKELSEKVNTFDGAYVWGVKSYFSDDTECIKIDNKYHVPIEAYTSFKSDGYSLMGKYVFDYDLKNIIKKFIYKKESITLIDIINEYINRRKMFFVEYKRGTVYSKIKDIDTLKKTSQLISLMEELQGNRIGDFECFRNQR